MRNVVALSIALASWATALAVAGEPAAPIADPVRAYPENYTVLFEDERVRVLDFRLQDIAAAKSALGMDTEHARKLDGLVDGWREVERSVQAELAAARSQLVIVQPTSVPRSDTSVNIALYAQQTTNAPGERIYARNRGIA